ncbi:hypothetical protein [Christiangramia sediminis]|uniref:Uncharacterized protein n=1 Tax=Christiangramia sediminis TaxID=2881336 RepID=A0A9X1RYC5_9FLAO|nr:hypothetical protein [Christiangramia sediminis]MCB7481594.1 hypothetical protein [Christiangramia sediminis]
MNGYEFSKAWFDFSFANSGKVKPVHTAIFFFAIERCNRLGWKSEFGFPTDLAMEVLGIKNYKTYSKALQDLVDWGFVQWIQKSRNQYTANVIALVKMTKAPTEALDKAVSEPCTMHNPEQVQSIVSINKLLNNKPLNLINLLNKKRLFEIEKIEIPKNHQDYFEWALKFQKLFLKNLKNKGAPLKKTENASFKEFVTPIRLMMESDKISKAQLQLAFELLDAEDEFWKGIILDTHKLRQKIGQLIAQRKIPPKTKEMDLRTTEKIKSYD